MPVMRGITFEIKDLGVELTGYVDASVNEKRIKEEVRVSYTGPANFFFFSLLTHATLL